MNEANRKACPFCGGKGVLKDTDNPNHWHIECELCGARRAYAWPNAKDAELAWNVRAGGKQPETTPNAEAIASSLERVVRRTPITDKNANGNVVSAELARTLEVMCQELATELDVEMNPGYSCQPLREWKSMQPAPNAAAQRQPN